MVTLIPFTRRRSLDLERAELVTYWRQLPELQRTCVLHLCRSLVNANHERQRARNLGKPVITIQPDGEAG